MPTKGKTGKKDDAHQVMRDEQHAMNRKIGERLKMVRQWKLMTQAEVARKLKMTRGRWSMYESGKRALSVYVMIEFCELVQGDPAFILMGKRPRQPKMIRDKQREAEKFVTDDGG